VPSVVAPRREERVIAERGKRGASKKIVLLSQHIEKLMVHIKHEAVAKARARDQKIKAMRELRLLK
jgi:hypothetical protein